MTRLWLMIWALFAATTLLPAAATAGEPEAFSDTAFARAQQGSNLVVLETYASWCLPCKLQKPLLAKAQALPEFRSMRLFRIGEETPVPVWRRFRLIGYGVIVVYRNGKEVGRGSPTNQQALLTLLRSRA